MQSLTQNFITLSNSLLATARTLPTPELLSPPTAEDSVEVARKTLRILRNLQGLQQDMENWLQMGELPAQAAKAELLQNLIDVYAGLVKISHLGNPELLNHFTIENANFATGSIALSIALHTLDILPDTSPALALLDADIEDVPDEWDLRLAQSVEHLLDDLEGGLAHLANKPMGDRSPIDQLLEISEKIQQTARELYSIDSLQEPAREESVELAREILRRLKNMLFSDKPIDEAIDTGKPNDKLAFARKISEMADMYKNLLAQAAISNPQIMQDPRVKKANDAVGDCADGVARMAIKDLPKKAQSKDNNQDQNGRSKAESIMKNMEGGVECAADEISNKKSGQEQKSSQAQAQSQAQEKAQARANDEAARATRRRQRREKAAAAIMESKPKPIIQQPIKSQTIAPASSQKSGQTRPQAVGVQANIQASGIAGLNMAALSAVRDAGSALRASNRQASNLLAADTQLAQASNEKRNAPIAEKPTSVSANDKISPDDKGFAQRKIEQDKDPRFPNNRPRIG